MSLLEERSARPHAHMYDVKSHHRACYMYAVRYIYLLPIIFHSSPLAPRTHCPWQPVARP